MLVLQKFERGVQESASLSLRYDGGDTQDPFSLSCRKSRLALKERTPYPPEGRRWHPDICPLSSRKVQCWSQETASLSSRSNDGVTQETASLSSRRIDRAIKKERQSSTIIGGYPDHGLHILHKRRRWHSRKGNLVLQKFGVWHAEYCLPVLQNSRVGHS